MTFVEADGKPNKRSKKEGAKGSVAILKQSTQLYCVSQDSYLRKSILRSSHFGSSHFQSRCFVCPLLVFARG